MAPLFLSLLPHALVSVGTPTSSGTPTPSPSIHNALANGQLIFRAVAITVGAGMLVAFLVEVFKPEISFIPRRVRRCLHRPIPGILVFMTLLVASGLASMVAPLVMAIGLFVIAIGVLPLCWWNPFSFTLEESGNSEKINEYAKREEELKDKIDCLTNDLAKSQYEVKWLAKQAEMRHQFIQTTANLAIKPLGGIGDPQLNGASQVSDQEIQRWFRLRVTDAANLLGSDDAYKAVIFKPDSEREVLRPWAWYRSTPTWFSIAPLGVKGAKTGKRPRNKSGASRTNHAGQTGLAAATWRDGKPRFVEFAQSPEGTWVPIDSQYAREYLPTKKNPAFHALALVAISEPDGDRLGVLCMSSMRPDAFRLPGLQEYVGAFADEIGAALTILNAVAAVAHPSGTEIAASPTSKSGT